MFVFYHMYVYVCRVEGAGVCRYVVTLGAPISIAQRMNDDTLTYLNKGVQSAMSHVCSIVHATCMVMFDYACSYSQASSTVSL